nr:hypothetical protein [Eubacterium sp.]
MDRELLEKEFREYVSQGVFDGYDLCIYRSIFPNQYLTHLMHRYDIDFECFVDTSDAYIGKPLCGKTVVSVDDLYTEYRQEGSGKLKILVFSSTPEEDREFLLQKGFTSEELVVFKNTPFEAKRNWTELLATDNRKKMWASLERGRDIFERIHRDGETLMIFPTSSIGDAYLLLVFLDVYLKKEGIDKVRFVYSGGVGKVVDLFGTYEQEKLSEDELSDLLRLVAVVGETASESVVMYPYQPFWRESRWIRDDRGWCEAIGCQVFGIDTRKEKFRFPVYDPESEEVMRAAGLVKGKTVILSPYAQSEHEFHPLLWEKMAERLKNKGFAVITSVVGSQAAVKGTEGIFIPINKLESYLQYAGIFIALR